MEDAKCKKCRRVGEKLFLKGERCLTPKCPMIRKPYPPGQRRKKRFKAVSEYGKELKEKQKLRNYYNISEQQFRNYVKEVLRSRGKVDDVSSLLIERLERRFDNIVFRLGFGSSRSQARQIISHNHFLVNGKPVNIPSFSLKKGDVIKVKTSSLKKPAFQGLAETLKKKEVPSWLSLEAKTLEAKIKSYPSIEDIIPPAEISSIFEYYSR